MPDANEAKSRSIRSLPHRRLLRHLGESGPAARA